MNSEINKQSSVWSWCPSSPTYRTTFKNYLPDVGDGEHLEMASSKNK